MATRETIGQVLVVLTAAYPRQAVPPDTARVYAQLPADPDDQVLVAAAQHHAATSKILKRTRHIPGSASLLTENASGCIMSSFIPEPEPSCPRVALIVCLLWRMGVINVNLARRTTGFLALLCLLVTLAACSPSGATGVPTAVPAPTDVPTPAPALAAEAGAPWPTESWRTSTPEEQGMDSQKLADMVAEIEARNINIDGFLIIRNGYLVSENYFGGFEPEITHDLQSVGRSFTATLLGIAIDKGYIDGVDQRVLDFFPEYTFANLDEQKKAMTLEDVLTMRLGLDWQETLEFRQGQQSSDDWLQFVLDLPVVAPPGSRWSYCSGCSHILMAILNKTTGMNPRDFAEENLFKPLGIEVKSWMADPAGIPYGAGGFYLTPRDMAKLGYLYLRNGEWDGRQIVSSEWVQAATQTYADVPIDEHFGYGYHWFTVPGMGGYAALGSGGQIILVIPESDLVIVTTAQTEESIFELIERYVLPAVQAAP